ncbi:MAG: isoprenyl transferase [candidate division KSB1 bacterium]|nr:isoprenyl transferase [candidate division KSB1 bacterium]MDQ7066433.1 isoprenyl transferase [candidate division KSB1 bacterium]
MDTTRKQREEQLKQEILSVGNIPQHVAIIMDGNGRWAKQRGLPRVEGHKEGINSVREVVRVAGEIGIQFLTLYTFSTENWHRPKGEVTALMHLLLDTIRAEVEELDKNNVKLMTIGRLEDLPFLPRKGMLQAIRRLRKNTGLTLNLALSYSSRREITDAVRAMVAKAYEGQLRPEDVNEELISAHLYTADIPDPDLLIRTSGELRVSNFLLWQLAYTEIYVTQIFWPEFRSVEFLEAVRCFQKRERRFGRVSEQLNAEQPSG